MRTTSPCRPPWTWRDPSSSRDPQGSLGLAHRRMPGCEPHLGRKGGSEKNLIPWWLQVVGLTYSEFEIDMLRLDLDGFVVRGGRALTAPTGGAGLAAEGAGPLQLPVLDDFEHIVGVDDVLGGTLNPG